MGVSDNPLRDIQLYFPQYTDLAAAYDLHNEINVARPLETWEKLVALEEYKQRMGIFQFVLFRQQYYLCQKLIHGSSCET